MLRSLFDTVGTRAEVNPVEVELKNLRLGELALEPDREQRLLQLAIDRALLREEKIFCELLRNRRATLGNPAMKHVGDQGAADAVGIDAAMLVEAPVLDGDESFGNVGRQFLQRQRRAGKVAAAGQRAALEVDDLDRRWAFRNFQRLDRRTMSTRLPRAGRDLRARVLRRFAGDLLFETGLSSVGAGRSSAETCRSGLLSNTGSRRAPACPRFDAITRPVSCRRTKVAGPRNHAMRGDLRGR